MKNINVQDNFSAHHSFRDVTSTARLFKFNRPVYITNNVWQECVEITNHQGKSADKLVVLQRLRHVLFMAASALHGQQQDLDYDFSVYCLEKSISESDSIPKAKKLHLTAYTDEYNMPIIAIDFAKH